MNIYLSKLTYQIKLPAELSYKIKCAFLHRISEFWICFKNKILYKTFVLKSFVEQMATKMTRLLPNTITKWFSSPSNANGSTQVAESTDSSTEDESTDSPLVNQPPAKRMRYNLPGPSNLYSVPEVSNLDYILHIHWKQIKTENLSFI